MRNMVRQQVPRASRLDGGQGTVRIRGRMYGAEGGSPGRVRERAPET